MNKILKNILIFSSIIFCLFASGKALAAWDPNKQSVGFFTGVSYTGTVDYTHVIQNAQNIYNNSAGSITGLYPILGSNHTTTPTKAMFIAYIEDQLNGQTKYAGSTQDEVGAAFIIQTMRGDAGGSTVHWPSDSDIADWEKRIYNPAVKFTVSSYSGSYNSGYSSVTKDDARVITSVADSVLRIYWPDVQNGTKVTSTFDIKINCGNVVGDATPLPLAQPTIQGYKTDGSSGLVGAFSLDKISATGATTAVSDYVSNPFTLNVNNEAIRVTADNNVSGWKVVGHSYTSCNTTTVTSDCSNKILPNSSITVSNLNYFDIPDARLGYVYTVRWFYRAVPLTVITGNKVASDGNSAVLGDTVRAYTSSGTLASSQNPFTFTVSSGQVTIKPDQSVPKYTVTSITINNIKCSLAAPLVCNPLPTNVPSIVNNSSWTTTIDDGYTYDITITYKPTSGVPPVCPDDPSIPNPPSINVSLPDATPNPQTSPAPTTSPNSFTTTYSKQGKTVVTNVNDISVGGNTNVVSFSDLLSQSYQQATVDYTKFIKTYPYDANQASVTYDSYYTSNLWKSSPTVSYYTYSYYCPTVVGSSLVSGPDANHNCTYSTPNKITTYAATAQTYTGTPSTTTSTYSGTPKTTTSTYTGTPKTVTTGSSPCWYYNVKTSNIAFGNSPLCFSTTTTYTCNSGDTGGGSSSTCTHSTTTYTCNSGDTGGGSSSTCTSTTVFICKSGDTLQGKTCVPTQTYTYFTQAANSIPTAWYNYSLYSSSANQTASSTAKAQLMNACYKRQFSVDSINSTNSTVTFNDNENPTSATAAGFTVSTTFSYPSNGPQNVSLRLPMKANLTYNYRLFNNGCTGSNAFVVTGSSGPGPALPNPTSITPGATCGVSLPPLAPGDTICANYTISTLSGLVNNVGVIQSSTPGTVSSGNKCSAPVVNKPYFKVYGSDISVGGGFYSTASGNKTCTSSNSSIFGWNTGTSSVYGSNQYAGAGAQFLLSSMGTLSGAASNQFNPNANPWPTFTSGSPKSDPIGLSLANVGSNSSAGNYGTSLGAATCMADYYSSLPSGTATIGSGSLSGNDGAYVMPSGSTIKSSNIAPGKRITIYVNGDLYISGNINFVGNYNTINDIPSLIFIVKDGNIFIDSSVSSLSGIFIAQSTLANKGIIYDCASGSSVIANNQLYANCGTQLTVNGSFIANKVVLNRTGNATNDKLKSSLRGATTNETNTSTNATEIFNYGPAFWINTALPISTSAGTTSAGYDSIINLPPVL